VSHLADLLSNVKREVEQKGDVPIQLRNLVLQSSRRKAQKRKYVFLLVIVLIAVLAGFGTIYFVDTYSRRVPAERTAKQPPVPAEVPSSAPLPPSTSVTQEMKTEPTATTERIATPENRPTAGPSAKTEAQAPQKTIAESVTSKPVIPLPATPKTWTPEPPKPVAKTRPELPSAPPAPPQPLAQRATEKPAPIPMAARAPAPSPVTPSVASSPSPSPLPSSPQNLAAPKEQHVATARSLEARGEFRQALEEYGKALGEDPRNFMIMNALAGLHLRLGSPEESVRLARLALSVKPDYAPALANLGIASLRLNSVKDGEAYLLKAQALDPSNRFVLLNLAVLYERSQSYDNAASYYRKLADSGDSQGYLGLGRVAEIKGLYREAEQIYREIVSMPGIDAKVKASAGDRLRELQR
jgi:tetratricopeptide (TPR) repeat protein